MQFHHAVRDLLLHEALGRQGEGTAPPGVQTSPHQLNSPSPFSLPLFYPPLYLPPFSLLSLSPSLPPFSPLSLSPSVLSFSLSPSLLSSFISLSLPPPLSLSLSSI